MEEERGSGGLESASEGPGPESEEEAAPDATEAPVSTSAPAPAVAGPESLQAVQFSPDEEHPAPAEPRTGDGESPIAAMAEAFAPLQQALQGALTQLDERSSGTRKTATALESVVQDLSHRVNALAERLDSVDGGDLEGAEEVEGSEMGEDGGEARTRRSSLARAPSRSASLRRMASMGGVAGVLERLSADVEEATSRLGALESTVGAPTPESGGEGEEEGGEEDDSPALWARVRTAAPFSR